MENLPSTQDHNQFVPQWSDKDIETLKNTICKGATNEELDLFIKVCKRTSLDPFARQIYAVQRWDNNLRRNVFSYQTSVDGFRLVAQRSKDYQGQIGPLWCGKDGKWTDVWLDDKNPPYAAKVGVWRAGFKEPLYALAIFNEYVQKKRDGSTTSMWVKMPALMVAKCAESLALRKAFPQELSGLYTSEEMGQSYSEDIVDQGDKKPVIVQTPIKSLAPITQPIAKDPLPPIELPKTPFDRIIYQIKQITKNHTNKELLEKLVSTYGSSSHLRGLPLDLQEGLAKRLESDLWMSDILEGGE